MLVHELEELLFRAFPATQAEDWDHVGLSVGDPASPVDRVMVALDATVDTVHAARDAAANVLVAHHPVYLSAPAAFVPRAGRAASQSAAAVYEAARLGISVMSFHTNLDRDPDARSLLPRMLGAVPLTSWESPDDPAAPGLGSIARVEPSTLGELADRCARVFSVQPRVWGDPGRSIEVLGCMGGSLGSMGELALAQGAQAIVCGEAGYHVCQDLAARGCGIVLLGHDVSEIPFVDLLRLVLARGGVDPGRIIMHTEKRQWWIPAERATDDNR